MNEFPKRCPWSHIHLNDGFECRPKDCGSCGWNPAVAQIRTLRIEKYAQAGKLKLWGKPEGDAWEKEHGS